MTADADNIAVAYEFLNRTSESNDAQDERFRALIEHQLAGLSKGHRDITGAAVAIEPVAQNEAPFLYRGRVVLYMRPENIVGVANHTTPEGALREASRAVERQVREQRDKLRERQQHS